MTVLERECRFESRRDLPLERVESLILLIRGRKVMFDSHLAELYGVSTKHLNEQAKRNKQRFPADFMFQLPPRRVPPFEVAICDLKTQTLRALSGSPSRPFRTQQADASSSRLAPARRSACVERNLSCFPLNGGNPI